MMNRRGFLGALGKLVAGAGAFLAVPPAILNPISSAINPGPPSWMYGKGSKDGGGFTLMMWFKCGPDSKHYVDGVEVDGKLTVIPDDGKWRHITTVYKPDKPLTVFWRERVVKGLSLDDLGFKITSVTEFNPST